MWRSLSLAMALLLVPAASRADEEVAEGMPAPPFTLRTMNHEESGVPLVSLDRYVGAEPEDAEARVVLISFFASWCAPCKKEMPYLQQLHSMYRDQGLRVVSVNIDREEPAIADARAMIAQAKVTFPVLSDRFNFLARRYLGEQSPLPSVFIVNRDGTIARIEKGYGRDASAFLLAEVQRALGLSVNRSARAPGPAAAR
ncbi:MAG TPA: TlpA disulfide reductase family protein [Anaeromyxobacteraceae bacterium]|nr:TlpA disulfide reductase family protein [Anaeromyxobacteraceae bacterium]